MRVLVTALVLLYLAIPTAVAGEIESRVKAVDREAIAQLGLSLASIAALLDASESSYQPRWALDDNAKYVTYQKLEAAGYLEIDVVKGLPDGSMPTEEFVVVRHTAKGASLARAVLGR